MHKETTVKYYLRFHKEKNPTGGQLQHLQLHHVHDLHQVHWGAKVSEDAFVIVKCIQFLNVVGKKMNAQKTFRKYHICL